MSSSDVSSYVPHGRVIVRFASDDLTGRPGDDGGVNNPGTGISCRMASYSLHLEGHGEDPMYVPSHDFPGELRAGDQFEYDGWTWRVTEVATKQFEAPGEPDKTIRAIAV
jgi:hypothetical protein